MSGAGRRDRNIGDLVRTTNHVPTFNNATTVAPRSDGTAHDVFRRGRRRRWLGGLVASVALHAVLLFGLPVIPTGETRTPRPELQVVTLPAEVTPAPPRVEIPEPVVPVPRPSPPNPEARTDTPRSVPPPQLTPHDVPPRLLNRREVEETLLDLYPGSLEVMEVGGVVTLWLYIDTRGDVIRTVVRDPSRFESFNRAAELVAKTMRFRPAQQAGNPVEVWVQQSIRFRTTEPAPTASRGETTGRGEP